VNPVPSLNPVELFLQADIIVKAVMLLLLAASIWSWAIILAAWGRLRRIGPATDKFEAELMAARDIEGFARTHDKSPLPAANVFRAAIEEWRLSSKGSRIDREGVRARLQTVMASTAAGEADALSDRLNVLATIGSVAPFVGLFGTVWGIMRSFTGIAAAQNTSLAVVAPGIAEALFATALGLFAAIPAVVAYNRLSHRVNRIEAGLTRFADRFHTTLSRELDAA
jgi:biopolymer transport protein TolQ